ncbi:alpha/beta hydrolase family protein [Haloferax larsenii]|uniref:Lysophospholipase, alpha-beta hydrolase superfamily n=1 Tax=Haloferax larsenii TaxID=302484 RepID=A0A1H7NKU0_HALLR|nr:alpha/beta fold hydrolase [Haloferax larsenii]SEL24113.1 Lysophospholipase, alpha-beta hydrolase superfamily [Haloferax larsenii]
MPVMEPTPEDIDLRAINYEADDGMELDGFEITSESETFHGEHTCVIFLHGLRGFALGAGISPVAYPLAREGIRCVSINKRNSGKGYETSDFAELDRDIAGAVDWATDNGATEVVIWGRSLGATEAAYFQGKRNDPDVDAVVLAAPFADIRERSTRSYFEALTDDADAAYENFVSNARDLVDAGRGNEIVALPRPVGGDIEYIPMTAESFLSYRSPESKCATIDWTPDIEIPILLLPHSSDRNVTPAEAEEIAETSTASPLVEVEPIAADHFFTGSERQVADLTASFIERAREYQ